MAFWADYRQFGSFEPNVRIADNSNIDLVYTGWVPEMGVAGLVVLTPLYDKLGLVRRRQYSVFDQMFPVIVPCRLRFVERCRNHSPILAPLFVGRVTSGHFNSSERYGTVMAHSDASCMEQAFAFMANRRSIAANPRRIHSDASLRWRPIAQRL